MIATGIKYLQKIFVIIGLLNNVNEKSNVHLPRLQDSS